VAQPVQVCFSPLGGQTTGGKAGNRRITHGYTVQAVRPG
jgi:hypothetical protein